MEDKLLKFLLVIFVIFLLVAGVLGLYYFATINTTFQTVISKIQPLSFIKKNEPKITISSEIPTLGVEVLDMEKIDNIFSKNGVWGKGIPRSLGNPALVVPKRINITLTNVSQEAYKISVGGESAKALGYKYSQMTGDMNWYMFYSKEYIEKIGIEKMTNAISADLIFYSYYLAGNRSTYILYDELYQEAGAIVTEFLNSGEKIIRVEQK